MALSSANRCYDFPLAEPGQSKRRARFFLRGRTKTVRRRAGACAGRGGNMEMQCLRLQADRNGRGVRGARNGALSTDSQQKKSRSERREHPARSCPNVE